MIVRRNEKNDDDDDDDDEYTITTTELYRFSKKNPPKVVRSRSPHHLIAERGPAGYVAARLALASPQRISIYPISPLASMFICLEPIASQLEPTFGQPWTLPRYSCTVLEGW